MAANPPRERGRVRINEEFLLAGTALRDDCSETHQRGHQSQWENHCRHAIEKGFRDEPERLDEYGRSDFLLVAGRGPLSRGPQD